MTAKWCDGWSQSLWVSITEHFSPLLTHCYYSSVYMLTSIDFHIQPIHSIHYTFECLFNCKLSFVGSTKPNQTFNWLNHIYTDISGLLLMHYSLTKYCNPCALSAKKSFNYYLKSFIMKWHQKWLFSDITWILQL